MLSTSSLPVDAARWLDEDMFTYADTSVCPSCRVPLPPGSDLEACGWCAAPLHDVVGVELLSTLRRADRLVAELRAKAVPVTVPAVPLPPPPPPATAVPVGAWTPGPPREGIRTTSVPAVLLSLGALCLLVAGVAFLAVAWTWLGVGGRTTVLVGLTVAAAGAGAALAGRGLRGAAESLTAVGAGLWLLDVVGADRAGWLGDLDPTALLLTCALALAAYGVVTGAVSPRLVGPQVVLPGGLLLAGLALADLTDRPLGVATATSVVLALIGAAGREAGRVALTRASGIAAGVAWLWLTGQGLLALAELPELTWSTLWLGGPGPALTLASAGLLLPVVVLGSQRVLSAGCWAATACAATGLVLLPALDESANRVTVALLVAAAGWTLASRAFSSRGAWATLAALAPAVVGAVPLALVAADLAVAAAQRAVLTLGDRLPPVDPGPHPLLLVPTTVVLLAVAHAVTPTVDRRLAACSAVAVLTVAVIATVALFPVPVWLVLALVLAASAVAAQVGLARDHAGGLAAWSVALLGLAFALAVAAHDAAQLVAVTGALTLLAVCTLVSGLFPLADELGDLLLPAAAAGLLCSIGASADVPAGHLGVPVLVLVGVLAIGRPRVGLELSAGLTALVVAPLAVLASADHATAAAIHLTVAGTLVMLSSLTHPDRRAFALPGTCLLLLATWVRLADLGVDTPEAYTLPAALLLLVAGLVRLRSEPAATSALALTPGLTLATVPSLLWVLATDPVSWRALLLGTACLALVLGGARLRWSSPVVVGSAVLAVLALAEVAPYVAQTPQWVTLGAAGTVLTLVGVTWERRLAEVRAVSERLTRLR